ncbi:hypothetical protein CDAR_484061 [Caerostris darwini]|uniref:Uncharacterized protein n=1 Tax=Caerostris darwini TaxID=1538125 RepID=A0AAV4T7Z4_9ARAC|nr:hypothetical protein CDAR_484061 [Caerostris darwini]
MTSYQLASDLAASKKIYITSNYLYVSRREIYKQPCEFCSIDGLLEEVVLLEPEISPRSSQLDVKTMRYKVLFIDTFQFSLYNRFQVTIDLGETWNSLSR